MSPAGLPSFPFSRAPVRCNETPKTPKTEDPCGFRLSRNPHPMWVPAFPDPTPCGFRDSRNPRAWVPAFPEPTPCGLRSFRNPRLWVPAFPEPTPCGLRSFRNPHPVGYGVSVTHTLCPMWVRGCLSSEPTYVESFIFRVSFSMVLLADGPRFLVF